MFPLKSRQHAKVCQSSGKRILRKLKKINYRNVRDHRPFTGKKRGAAYSIRNLRFNVPNEIPVIFHSRWNYDYHFF